jgi:hypothetical protein
VIALNVRAKLGERLGLVKKGLKAGRIEDASNEYKTLARLFNRLHGYDNNEVDSFFKEMKLLGDEILIELMKKRINNEEKVDLEDFKDILNRKTKASTGFEDVARLIDVGLYEEALKKYKKA